MYKKTQAHQEYLKRTGKYSDRIHPARGLIENIINSDATIDEKRHALYEMSMALELERADIDARLRKAKDEVSFLSGRAYTTGKFASPEHFRTVKGDATKYQNLLQHILSLKSHVKTLLKDYSDTNIGFNFINVARRQLPSGIFDVIMKEAVIVMNNAGERSTEIVLPEEVEDVRAP